VSHGGIDCGTIVMTHIAPAWLETLAWARSERRKIWDAMLEAGRESGEIETLPGNIEELGALYTDLRLSMDRVMAACQQGGSLIGIPVDPRPEDADETARTVLEDWFDYSFRVCEEARKIGDLEEIDPANPDHLALYARAEAELFDSGRDKNPLF